MVIQYIYMGKYSNILYKYNMLYIAGICCVYILLSGCIDIQK